MICANIYAVWALLICLKTVAGNRDLYWLSVDTKRGSSTSERPELIVISTKEPLQHSDQEENLRLASYDLVLLSKMDTRQVRGLVNELVHECAAFNYHVIAFQNCTREFMESFVTSVNASRGRYKPLHCFGFKHPGVCNPGLVTIFDGQRVSLIDAKKSLMTQHPYFTALCTDYSKLPAIENFFNLESTDIGEKRPPSLSDDLAILAYFAFKNSPVRFKIANMRRSVEINDIAVINQIPAPEGLGVVLPEYSVFMMHPINRFMHLPTRHALVKMQYFLGQSSCFDDHKFVMGNPGVARTSYGRGPLISTLLYGRVPYLNYSLYLTVDEAKKHQETAIYTGVYDSVFFINERSFDPRLAWKHLDIDGRNNLILNSRKAVLQGTLHHIKHDTPIECAPGHKKPYTPPRFSAKGSEGMEFWGACYKLTPIRSPYAYSKHQRLLYKQVYRHDAHKKTLDAGSKILGLPNSDKAERTATCKTIANLFDWIS